jgi:hypothetical protein
MPKFVYKPEGVEPKSWDFDPAKLMNPEAEAIERHTQMTYGEWQEALGRNSMLAFHGLLFVFLKRETPTLKWGDVQFSLSELDLELSDEESAEALAALEKKIADGETLDASESRLWAVLKETAPTEEQAPAVPKG